MGMRVAKIMVMKVVEGGAFKRSYRWGDELQDLIIGAAGAAGLGDSAMAASVITGPFSLEKVVDGVEKVRQRLLRAVGALRKADIMYAVVGGNAVALWVSRVDAGAVRNTRDVDLMLRRSDLPAAKAALEAAGFVYRHMAGLDVFLDSPTATARDALHIVFANEKVRPHEPVANPDVTAAEENPGGDRIRVMGLEALVQIKLTAFRDKDRTHLRDLIEVGLVDETWMERLPAVLAERLRQLLDTPEG